jgi:hypothetical protein
MNKILLFFLTFGLVACNRQANKNTAQGSWIKGTETEKINTIEKQFRGFDNTMVETGYRYQELYWAGQDQNWEYADYQLEKIKTAIENGIERRPKRANSAKVFLTYGLPEMKKVLENRSSSTFNEGFKTLTANCNSCHAMEKVPFFAVKTPSDRQSPIKR